MWTDPARALPRPGQRGAGRFDPSRGDPGDNVSVIIIDVNFGVELQRCRLLAGLSQRALAERTGFKQPAIARIESGAVLPRVDTYERLLAGCAREIATVDERGQGVDRTVMRRLLKLTPRQRLELAAQEAMNIAPLMGAARR